MHTISSYRGNRPTHPQTHTPSHAHTHKQTGPITTQCSVASAQCNNKKLSYRWQNRATRSV